jgi:hypothetical protein
MKDKYTRTSYRKRYKRRRGKKRFLKKFQPVIGFPRTSYVKMRYCDTITITPSVLLNEYVLRMNGIFDPDYQIGGHQPLGHDQWAQFYNKYVVYRSDIRLKFCIDNNTAIPGGLGLYMSSSPTTGAVSVIQLQEQGHSTVKILSPTTNGNAFTLNNTLRLNYNAKKWHNVTNVSDNTNLEADFGADPVDETYCVIFYGAMDENASSAPSPITINYEINYYVLCKDVKELSTS